MNTEQVAGTVTGFFSIEKMDREENIIEKYEFKNIVTNYGLKKIMESGLSNTRVSLFADSNPISPDDSSVIIDRTESNANLNPSISSEYKHEENKLIGTFTSFVDFSEASVNKNFNKIAITENGVPVAVTLIKADNGDPVVIQQNVGERIRVSYILVIEISTRDVVFNNIDAGELGNFDVTIRVTNNNDFFRNFQSLGIHVINTPCWLKREMIAKNNNVPLTNIIPNSSDTLHSTEVVVEPNVVKRIYNFGMLYTDKLHSGSIDNRSDDIQTAVIPYSFGQVQIGFNRPLGYFSKRANLKFSVTFSLTRG